MVARLGGKVWLQALVARFGGNVWLQGLVVRFGAHGQTHQLYWKVNVKFSTFNDGVGWRCTAVVAGPVLGIVAAHLLPAAQHQPQQLGDSPRHPHQHLCNLLSLALKCIFWPGSDNF